MADIFSHQALTQNEMDGKPIAGIATLKVKLQLSSIAAFLTIPRQRREGSTLGVGLWSKVTRIFIYRIYTKHRVLYFRFYKKTKLSFRVNFYDYFINLTTLKYLNVKVMH